MLSDYNYSFICGKTAAKTVYTIYPATVPNVLLMISSISVTPRLVINCIVSMPYEKRKPVTVTAARVLNRLWINGSKNPSGTKNSIFKNICKNQNRWLGRSIIACTSRNGSNITPLLFGIRRTEYSAPVEHPRPAKLNTCVADNEQCRRSSCTLTS